MIELLTNSIIISFIVYVYSIHIQHKIITNKKIDKLTQCVYCLSFWLSIVAGFFLGYSIVNVMLIAIIGFWLQVFYQKNNPFLF
jgi:hypothetical protein